MRKHLIFRKDSFFPRDYPKFYIKSPSHLPSHHGSFYCTARQKILSCRRGSWDSNPSGPKCILGMRPRAPLTVGSTKLIPGYSLFCWSNPSMMLVLLRPLSRAAQQQKLPSRYPAFFGIRTHSLPRPQISSPCRSNSSTANSTPTPTPAQTYTPRTMPLPRSEYLSDVWKDGIFGITLFPLQNSTPKFV